MLLGHAPEIAAACRRPVSGHIEVHRIGKDAACRDPAHRSIPWQLHRIDGQRHAMRQQFDPALAVHHRDTGPQVIGIGRKLRAPSIVPHVQRLRCCCVTDAIGVTA